MSGQDYNKDLYIVLVGSGTSTVKNLVDNLEDYIFGPRDEREATLLVPYTEDLTPSLGKILNEWAIGDDDEPNYPIFAFVENESGHKSIASAKETFHVTDEDRVAMESAATEAAMHRLVELQKEGNEVVAVVLYDEEKDVKLVGELKNYQSVPVLNLDGMIDSFPGFRTTDEILEEERKREEFETKEAIRLAAEKEQEKAEKATAKKAAAPRKRAAAKTAPEEKPLTETTPRKAAAPRKKAAAPKPEPVEAKVVEETSELPKELEPVKTLPAPVSEPVPDLWADVSKAQAAVSVPGDKLVVSKESMAQLGEGIQEMSKAYSKTIAALTDMLRDQK